MAATRSGWLINATTFERGGGANPPVSVVAGRVPSVAGCQLINAADQPVGATDSARVTNPAGTSLRAERPLRRTSRLRYVTSAGSFAELRAERADRRRSSLIGPAGHYSFVVTRAERAPDRAEAIDIRSVRADLTHA